MAVTIRGTPAVSFAGVRAAGIREIAAVGDNDPDALNPSRNATTAVNTTVTRVKRRFISNR
jgi:hypothetical protein